MRSDAGWRQREISHNAYMMKARGTVSPLVKIIGYNLYRVWVDSMHCKGNTAYITANVIYDVALQGHFGTDQMRTRLARIHKEYNKPRPRRRGRFHP